MNATARLCAIAAITALLTAAAFTGNEYLEYRQRPQGSFASGYTAGNTTGIVESLGGIFFCVPTGARVSQGIAIADRYMAAHPESLQKDADVLIVAALKEASPCPTAAPAK